jgi:protein-export membrane protein SecD
MRRFLKLKALALLALIVTAVMAVLPSFLPPEKLPTFISETFTRKFQLGLDLQGGLHLEYSVAVDEAIENKLDQIAAELEIGFREKKDIEVEVTRDGMDTLLVTLPTAEDVALATDDVMGVTFGVLEQVDPEDDQPANVIRLRMPEAAIADNRKAAVANALETVSKRVDAMGVAEPNIYPKNRQIVIELPGLADENTELRAAATDAAGRVSQIVSAAGAGTQVSTSEVRDQAGQFKVTVPGGDANELLQTAFAGKIAEDGIIVDERLPAELQILPPDPTQPDPSTAVLGLTDRARDQILAGASEFHRLLKIIERQAVLRMHLVDDETPFRDTGVPYLRALFEAGKVTQGMGIAVNIESDYGREGGVMVREPFVYYAKDLQTLESFFAGLPPEWRLPADMKVVFGPTTFPVRKGQPEDLYRTYVIKARAEVTGESIVSASVGFDQQSGSPEVNVKLDRVGADLFEEMSGSNVGRKMAIILDELVRSDPVFNERIPGGNVRISLGSSPGQSAREAANDLTKVLKSGSLPARLQKESEMRVGADLGSDAVDQGAKAFAIGLIAVVAFMGVYYRRAGWVANFALVLNVLIMLALMAFFRATLTLPGIAGIVLTLGMAVDANVIVYERIRELIRDGYTARAAIDAGYERAFTSILDSQLTTAIAGLVLWQYGSGPIRGFAVTLLIGIATSIFTGVFCTRLFFDFQANRRGFDKVSI